MTTNTWYHVAVTNIGNTATLYLDGAAVGSTTVTINTPADTSFYIGRIPGVLGDPRKLDGIVDEVSVYNRALSASELQAIYNAGVDGKSHNYFTADRPSVTEGPAISTTNVTFTITRTGDLSGQATVNWSTSDGTATAGADYIAANGQAVFQDGESQKTVQVTVNGDNTPESNETFNLVLSTTTPGYGVGGGQATIVEDDFGISISDDILVEGAAGLRFFDAFVNQADNGGLNLATGMSFGPDGNLYVGSLNSGQVLRYNATTGAFMGAFVTSGSGGLTTPAQEGLVFRPDGKLYVASRDNATVLRYDATTGAFLDTFVPANSGGLSSIKGMVFGPDGSLYLSSAGTNQVLRYDGTTGAFLGVFVAAGSGGLSIPRSLTFGPDGNLYVSSGGTGSILRYNGTTGAFLNAFIPRTWAALLIRPDSCSQTPACTWRIKGTTRSCATTPRRGHSSKPQYRRTAAV